MRWLDQAAGVLLFVLFLPLFVGGVLFLMVGGTKPLFERVSQRVNGVDQTILRFNRSGFRGLSVFDDSSFGKLPGLLAVISGRIGLGEFIGLLERR